MANRNTAKRRTQPVLLWVVAFLLAAPAPVWSQSGQSPNIVLIIADDQGWTDYGFMGHPFVSTPNIDQLAAEGMTFERAYVPASLCRPSLATIITGLHPHQHGIVGNDAAPGRNRAASRARQGQLIARLADSATLPQLLAERGYVSFQAGKWWEGSFRQGGFTHGMTRGFPDTGGRHGDDGLKIGREGLQEVFDFVDEAAAVRQPFLLWYAPLMPHRPHNPPTSLYLKYRLNASSDSQASYWAMCEWFDQTVGELLGFLDNRRLAQDTLVIFLADNGWISDPESKTFAARSKRSPFEGGIRTPLVLRWPGRIEPGRNREDAVSSIDVAPTVLGAVGLGASADMTGINLLSDSAVRGRPRIYGEIFAHTVSEIENPLADLRYQWIIEGPWKLILPRAGRTPGDAAQLYDLAADPGETNDLSASLPARVSGLTARLKPWWPEAAVHPQN